MVMLYLVASIVWIILTKFAYEEGQKREVGGTITLILSIFLSPLIALIVVGISRPLVVDDSRNTALEPAIMQEKVPTLKKEERMRLIASLLRSSRN